MRRLFFSLLRVIVGLATIIILTWWFMIRMPGKSGLHPAALSPDEVGLREELRSDVEKLAGEIGERNLRRYPALIEAADFIERSFVAAGLQPKPDSYALRGRACRNIEAEIIGTGSRIVVDGAHYDSAQ